MEVMVLLLVMEAEVAVARTGNPMAVVVETEDFQEEEGEEEERRTRQPLQG
jgi:PHD/YefM family antitoxin component YafN of YafNO toxin-antitoxin module